MSAGRAPHAGAATEPVLEPARPSERVARVFAWYCRRLFRKRFHALRATPALIDTMRMLDVHDGPAVVNLNHSAWWDPLVGFLLATDRTPSRQGSSPMEMAQWKQFGFFKKLGVFGIEPDAPGAVEALAEHAAMLFNASDRGTLWITPQGRFADVREPARLRPGAAAVCAHDDAKRGASAHERPRVMLVSLAIEYAFWTDQRPELLLHARMLDEPPQAPASTAHWLRAQTRHMRRVQSELAELVIARDPAAFVPAFAWAESAAGSGADGEPARVNPFYDLWLRLRGKSGRVIQRDQQRKENQVERTA